MTLVRRIGISMGDVNGVGPEVALLAAHALASARVEWTLVGSARVAEIVADTLRLPPPRRISGLDTPPRAGTFTLWSPPGAPEPRFHPGVSTVTAARAAYSWIQAATDAAGAGRLDALVTAPIHKAGFHRAGLPAQGHTEIIAGRLGIRKYGMLLSGGGLRVMLATRHLPLARVPRAITPALLREQLALLHDSLPWLGVRGPGRIAVAGLNPHAGDGGALGREEEDIIAPVVRAARRRRWNVIGPMAGDTVFHFARTGGADAVLAMYHDQGLAALKTVAFDEGVNITLGLPIVRTSPDHGTAFEIAGRAAARPHSMIAALRCADELSRRPNPWARR
ncbi:MAG: 4-hydroxythreonine-4-phosphate dehydrogenase PdxA [Kiritimatiellae bacterium]|nr:4-hydroxythreonine-4-phosphate dehydrogenase PdxA [Kiritimatiellia bacterium]